MFLHTNLILQFNLLNDIPILYHVTCEFLIEVVQSLIHNYILTVIYYVGHAIHIIITLIKYIISSLIWSNFRVTDKKFMHFHSPSDSVVIKRYTYKNVMQNAP